MECRLKYVARSSMTANSEASSSHYMLQLCPISEHSPVVLSGHPDFKASSESRNSLPLHLKFRPDLAV